MPKFRDAVILSLYPIPNILNIKCIRYFSMPVESFCSILSESKIHSKLSRFHSWRTLFYLQHSVDLCVSMFSEKKLASIPTFLFEHTRLRVCFSREHKLSLIVRALLWFQLMTDNGYISPMNISSCWERCCKFRK